jgi:hypothetical protein
MKSLHLVAYDYGQGAVWAFVAAESLTVILDRFPELRVFETPPAWMTDDELARIEAKMSFDVDHPTGWLAALADRRDKPP